MGTQGVTLLRSLSVLVEQYLTELGNSGAEELTITTYRNRLGWWGDWLGATGISLESVTRDTIQQWISDQRVRVSPKTKRPLSKKYIRDNVAAVHAFFKWLVGVGKLDRDPMSGLRPLKVPDKIPDVISVEDVNRLIDGAANTRERVVLELLYGSGIRKAELIGIDVDHVDLVGRQVKVMGKGARERMQPISHQAVDAIRAYLVDREEELARGDRRDLRALIVTRQGRIGRQTVQDLVKAVAERVGIDRRVYPHLFRHCFATHLLDGGADLVDIQELLDHKSISTTRVYTRVSRQRIRRVFEAAHPRAQMR